MPSSSNVAQSSEEADLVLVASVKLPRDLWKSARLKAVETDTTIGAFVEEAIREKLAKANRKSS